MSEFLKCDATGCDHRELVDVITADMVGKPCPKCGANLLTQHDWDHYSAFFKPMLAALESAGVSRPALPGEKGAFSVNYHEGQTVITAPVESPADL